jgi:hypothetical protein
VSIACGSDSPEIVTKSEPVTRPTGKDTPAPDARVEPARPTVPWKLDTTTMLAKLDGAWVVKGFGSAGDIKAWRLDKGKVTIYAPKTKQENLDELELWSPCKAHLRSGYGGTLVVDGGDVYLGLGGGGKRYGDAIIACMGTGTVVATKKGCAMYEVRFGNVTVIPTRCWHHDGYFETLEGTDRRQDTLMFWGSDRVLLSDQLSEGKLEKYASWDAAKAAADLVAAGKPAPRGVARTDASIDDPVSFVEPAFPPAPPEPKREVPWSDDHAKDALAKLQGVWLVKGFGSYGSVSAWKFDGAKVTVFDPRKQTERPDVLLFDSPVSVRLFSGYGGTLVIDGDSIYLGLGGGGTKQGATIYAQMGSGTVVATKSGCTTYKHELREWKKIETTCAEANGRFQATEKSSYGESSLRFVNERTLLSDQLAASKLVKQPDWATAKAAASRP